MFFFFSSRRRHTRCSRDWSSDVCSSDLPAFGNLGTLMKDGSPQVTPIWVDYDGKFVRFNSAKGRVKDKNIRRDPRVSISLQDPANPYRYLEIRGKVVEITENGADDHINKLSKKYLGNPVYPFRKPGEVRVTYKIEPEKVSSLGRQRNFTPTT